MTARLEMKSSESEAPLIGDMVKACLDLGQFTAIPGILGLGWAYSGLFGNILGHFGPISGVMGLDLGWIWAYF